MLFTEAMNSLFTFFYASTDKKIKKAKVTHIFFIDDPDDKVYRFGFDLEHKLPDGVSVRLSYEKEIKMESIQSVKQPPQPPMPFDDPAVPVAFRLVGAGGGIQVRFKNDDTWHTWVQTNDAALLKAHMDYLRAWGVLEER